jgi:hypothetical protein
MVNIKYNSVYAVLGSGSINAPAPVWQIFELTRNVPAGIVIYFKGM